MPLVSSRHSSKVDALRPSENTFIRLVAASCSESGTSVDLASFKPADDSDSSALVGALGVTPTALVAAAAEKLDIMPCFNIAWLKVSEDPSAFSLPF